MLLDSCEWGQSLTFQVSAGQTVPSVSFTIAAGALLQVHVNDPDHVLSQAGKSSSPSNPAPGDSQVMVMLRGQDHLIHQVPITGRTASGRDHSLIVPTRMLLSLGVNGARFGVLDSLGRSLAAELPVQASAGGVVTPIDVTLRGAKP